MCVCVQANFLVIVYRLRDIMLRDVSDDVIVMYCGLEFKPGYRLKSSTKVNADVYVPGNVRLTDVLLNIL